jgi:AAA-like domain/Effector-associated domain 4
MTRLSYGPKVQQRTKSLLEALIAYANDEMEDCQSLQTSVRWRKENQLVVTTKLRFLEELTAKNNNKLNTEEIYEAIKCLKNFLEILEDNRTKDKGCEDWHFTLKLWYKRREQEANLRQFDEEWERRRSKKPEQYIPEKPMSKQQPVPIPQSAKPEIKDQSIPLTSSFYVERPPTETNCYKALLQAGALIRIKAPKQMGKTLLLHQIVAYATQQNYRTVRLNLLQAEEAVFGNLDKFLRWFCTRVSQKLQFPTQLNEYWDEERGSIVNCTTYFEAHLLEQIDTPLLLALDEVDRIFQFPEITQGFFPMLRSWHEEAKTIESWEKLRLVVVHSTEDYGSLDINQSPFNVGLPIELAEFTSEQIEDLAQRYQLNWTTQIGDKGFAPLQAMVGGHPFLISWALNHLAHQNMTLQQLLQDASTDAGIYQDHLRRHLVTLQENPKLAAAMKQVVSSFEPVRLETMQAYKLYSMGLIKRQGNDVISRCLLYQQYFLEHLHD